VTRQKGEKSPRSTRRGGRGLHPLRSGEGRSDIIRGGGPAETRRASEKDRRWVARRSELAAAGRGNGRASHREILNAGISLTELDHVRCGPKGGKPRGGAQWPGGRPKKISEIKKQEGKITETFRRVASLYKAGRKEDVSNYPGPTMRGWGVGHEKPG